MNAAVTPAVQQMAQSLEELLHVVAQQKLEIAALSAQLELERVLRRNSNARLIAAGGVFMAKVGELDTIIAARVP